MVSPHASHIVMPRPPLESADLSRSIKKKGDDQEKSPIGDKLALIEILTADQNKARYINPNDFC